MGRGLSENQKKILLMIYPRIVKGYIFYRPTASNYTIRKKIYGPEYMIDGTCGENRSRAAVSRSLKRLRQRGLNTSDNCLTDKGFEAITELRKDPQIAIDTNIEMDNLKGYNLHPYDVSHLDHWESVW